MSPQVLSTSGWLYAADQHRDIVHGLSGPVSLVGFLGLHVSAYSSYVSL